MKEEEEGEEEKTEKRENKTKRRKHLHSLLKTGHAIPPPTQPSCL